MNALIDACILVDTFSFSEDWSEPYSLLSFKLLPRSLARTEAKLIPV